MSNSLHTRPRSAALSAHGAAFPHGAAASGVRPDHYQLYRQVAEQLPRGAVFVVDTELRYRLAAGASLDEAGYLPSDFEGRLLSDAVSEQDYPRYASDYRQLLAGGRFTREHEVNGLDFVSHGVPLLDRDGRIHAALVVSYDITERKCAERRFALLDELAEAIRAARAASDIEAAARNTLARYFGNVDCAFIGPQELHGDRTAPWLSEEALRTLAAAPDLLLMYPETGGSAMACPFHADGALAGATLVTSALPQPWMEIDRSFMRAVSDRAWAHMERLRLVAALREADRQKDRHLAVLAHELRNPLAALRNGLSLLSLGSAQAAPERVLGLMEQQASHMGRLIEDVLDAAWIRHGHMSLQRRRLALSDLVRAAVEAARVPARERGQELVCEPGIDALTVDADPTRLAQALSNVVSNAIKYSTAPGTIRITLRREGASAVLAVADQGIGMSEATRRRLFELFVRGGDAPMASTGAGGLGVGLWLTHRLVEAHGGTITAASAGIGQGSTFTITLPLA